ncbi:MAG: hypothetical protein ACOVP4_10665 [Bacteriovoracaceae bacterium]|jgi:hypothetical protein
MKEILRKMTREKHLDHMVKVTPLIFLGYGLQCYFLMGMNTEGHLTKHLIALGVALASMIALFLIHDVYHQVSFFDDHLESGWRFFGKKRTINYNEISKIDISEADQKFASLILRLQNNKKIVFYFVDAPEELKTWIESQKESSSPLSLAA